MKYMTICWPLYGAYGFYRGYNNKPDELGVQRFCNGYMNAMVHMFMPYVPISKAWARWEIDNYKPHLKEANKWAYTESLTW